MIFLGDSKFGVAVRSVNRRHLVSLVSLALLLLAVSLGFRGSQARAVDAPLDGQGDPASVEQRAVLPCVKREVVLTAVYVRGSSLRFEGVARPSLAGQQVRFESYGQELRTTPATVLPDGTFWATFRMHPALVLFGTMKFRAIVGEHASRPRRLAQAVDILGRVPSQNRSLTADPLIEVKVDGGLQRDVVVGRQVGCTKDKLQRVHTVFTRGDGTALIRLPRPAAGEPFAVYRLRTGDRERVSSPIVVRPQL